MHKRPKWYARFKVTKWFNKNWSDQYEEWEKIKNKLKINLTNQNQKNQDRKIQSIDPVDFLSNRNQNKISTWNEEIKKIKTEMINLHVRKLITTIYWEKILQKVNASTDTNEIKDLIEEEYQNNFVVFTNNNKNEIDEQFQLVQSKIMSISPSNEEVIKTIFESLQNKVMEFSNNDLQTKNKIIQIDFKSIKNIFQHFEDEIKNKIENDTDVLDLLHNVFKF